MTRRWTATASLAGALLLQVGLAPHLAIARVTPSLPLLVVVTLALVQGPSSGATAGFVAGVVLDLLGSGPVGAWALVLSLTGYLAGMLHENLFAEGWVAPVTVAVVAGLLAETAYLLLLTVLGVAPTFWEAAVSVVLPRAVYNALLVVLVYPWLARFVRSDRTVKSFRRLA